MRKRRERKGEEERRKELVIRDTMNTKLLIIIDAPN